MLKLLSQPKPQSSDTAIFTLCDRLTNSLLIEDRKAAVLALRGLAHENRELVASSGLQGLLDVLIKDSHDPDAAKATLETLLILFNTDTRRKVRNRRYISPLIQRKIRDSSVEPAESVISDISLWLTDRLLHSEEALSRVLELATTKDDPFTAVYALQLVSVMASNRPIESKQILLSSGGIAPLVSALGSVQDMVRDEALLLLNALTTDHLDLQKLVAFEGGFDKAFAVLNDGGGAVFGGRVAEDCLSLVANLLEYNTSNQKLFTQSGYVSHWTRVLESIIDAQNEGTPFREQANSNIEATLAIGQLLCVSGAEQNETNQNILHDYNALTLTLQIAFGPSSPPPVRVSALITVASLVNSNNALQNDLLSMDVPYYDLTIPRVVMIEPRTVPVSQALLNWAINLSATHLFDLRCASLLCLSSAFNDNHQAKSNFVGEQIERYHKLSDFMSGTEESVANGSETTNHSEGHNAEPLSDGADYNNEDVNLIEVLAEYSDDTRLNPFRIWFASAITMRLFINSPEFKDQLGKVKIGKESLGMEVHSLIQAIAGEMQGSLQFGEPTVALGYLQLIAVWIYDDVEGVNEFTRESSAIQTLLAHQTSDPLVESLAAIVLGISYAFCTKESPLPRNDFHRLLTQTLGRDQYMLLVKKFRQSHVFQNFDENDMFDAPRNSNGSPAVYLDAAFVGLMRETIGYISRAIDANPDIEPSSRVTFEMLDEVKHTLHEKSKALETAESQLSEIQREHKELTAKFDETSKLALEHENSSKEHSEKLSQVEKELEKHKRDATTVQSELNKIKSDLETKSSSHAKLEASYSKQSSDLSTVKSAKEKAEEGVNNLTRELFQLQRAKEASEKETSKLQAEVSKLKPKLEAALKSEGELKKKLHESQKDATEAKSSLEDTKKVNEKLVAKLRETAADLKQREEEEEELRAQLSKIKLESESQSNELLTLRNREASSRKNLELAQTEIKKLKDSQASDGSGISAKQAEIDNLKSTIDELRNQSSDLSKENETKATALKDLENKLKEAESQGKSATEESKKNTESLKASNDKLKEVNMKLVKDLGELKKTLQTQQDNANKQDKPDKDSAETPSEIVNLKAELDEKQNALDELMVLLDDLSEKKSSYKTKLRELKQEVSDSEDDEDGDDDGEE